MTLSPLQLALVEKVVIDHGFEHRLTADDPTFGSARHGARVAILSAAGGFVVRIIDGPAHLEAELARQFAPARAAGFHASEESGLAQLLRRTAALAQSLPHQAADDYGQRVAAELDTLPAAARDTEVERMVRQRIGQDLFRRAQLEYWGHRCAVTGITTHAVLRASHALPWSECPSDTQRLDVFNGLLLAAHLDALFDRFLITFDPAGALQVSPLIDEAERHRLGLHPPLHLRWIADAHQPYLDHHRSRFHQLITDLDGPVPG